MDPIPLEDGDYYFEGNVMVFTAQYLRKRGYCCHNGCRHCPYPKETPDPESSGKDAGKSEE